jgi:anti-anti-sigma factor
MPLETEASVPVLAPSGDLDLATARGLGATLSELAGAPGNAVLDLSDVEFMDSTGMAVVLKAVNRFRRQDKCLALVVPPDGNVARLLDLAGTRGRLTVAPDRDAALALATTGR